MVRAAPLPWEEAYRRQGRLWRGSRLDPWTLRLLEDPARSGGLWFDAGCGDGKGLAPLVQRVKPGQVVGADRALWGLRLVRQEVAPAGPRLVRADACAWPFASGTFDVVRAVHLIGHLDATARARGMAELARVTRPGGTLLLVEFGSGDFRCGSGDQVEHRSFRRGTGIVTHYFDEGELAGLAEGAGLEVETVDAERFQVTYGDMVRPRERWVVQATRPN